MACGGETKRYTDQPKWFDPLGPGKRNEGRRYRTDIYGRLPGATGTATHFANMAANRAAQAAAHPGWASAADVAGRTARGEYLQGSPYLDAALRKAREATTQGLATQRARSLADYAGQAAGVRSAYSRGGLAYSTASQQAEQAGKAALLARLGEAEAGALSDLGAQEASLRAQNYEMERGRQMQAPQMLGAATQAPLEYLSGISQTHQAPISQEAQIVSGLSGGGQIATPQSAYVRKPGAIDYTMGFISSLSGGGMQGGGGGW